VNFLCNLGSSTSRSARRLRAAFLLRNGLEGPSVAWSQHWEATSTLRACVLRRFVLSICAAGMAAAILSACSGGGGAASVPGSTRTISDKGGSNQVSDVSATPTVLTFAAAGVSATFVVNSGSGHEISATVADPSCASVSPAAQKPDSQGGGNHTATFTVTSVNAAGCSTTITLVANGHNTASVAVTVAAPTPAPTTTTGAGGVPTGI
jgi:hypothetical protein